MDLFDFEKKYSKYLHNQYSKLIKLYNDIKSKPLSLIKRRDITYAILYRMKTYYELQNNIKKFLNKRYASAASDFFVETITFYLKLVIEMKNKKLKVCSERQIKPKRGFMRPDISIWEGEQVKAIIECKTQLGWNRLNWEKDFTNREKELKKIYPRANAYLLIMTSENWPGIPQENKYIGKKYFTLSKTWPTNIDFKDIENVIINPIEDLFIELLS